MLVLSAHTSCRLLELGYEDVNVHIVTGYNEVGLKLKKDHSLNKFRKQKTISLCKV